MAVLAAALLVALAVSGCSERARALMPTGPTPGPSTAPGTGSTLRLLRTELWNLELSVQGVFGAGDCDAASTPTRNTLLRMEFFDNATVALSYDHPDSPSDHAADWTGWVLEGGLEGSGTAYEGLPCSGAELEPSGAPTTLTGYFGADGQTFSAIEVRRYMGRADGEIVYHLEWRAAKSH
jgi:hypothetical protein